MCSVVAVSSTYNATLLMKHVLEKGFQFGSVLGTVAVVPIAMWRKSENRSPAKALKILGTSALVGTAFALVLGSTKMARIPADEFADGMQDRAYRLHYNKGQNRADTFSRVGMASGGLAAMFLIPSAAAPVILGGSAFGSACGIFAHVATLPKGEKTE